MTGNKTKTKGEPSRATDLELGRDHLVGYSGWPPPKHIREHLEVFTNFLEQNLDGKKLLDLGCGDGAIDRLLAENNPELDITAVDLEPHEQWNFRHPKNLRFQTASVFKLPYKADSFDTVIIKDVLHHLPNPEKIIAELARIAKNQVIIIEANRYNPISYIRMVRIAKHDHLSYGKLKRVVGRSANIKSVEAHVWPNSLKAVGKVSDLLFNKIPVLARIRNYNFLIFKP